MSERDAFDRILASIRQATLNDAQWSAASALIDEACGTKGNLLVHGEGCSEDDFRIFLARLVSRGQRDEELERDYFNFYYPRDERLPRLRRRPDSQLVHVSELFTREEKKTSVVYNEVLVRGQSLNSIMVRLDGPNGSRIIWGTADPIDADGWSSARTRWVRRLLPHIRHFVTIRHALAEAGALGATLTGMLQQSGTGIIQLDGRGRIVAASDRALHYLRRSDCLFDRNRFLHARSAPENAVLRQLLVRALPPRGERGVGGSMTVSGPGVVPGLMVHISPVGQDTTGFGAYRIAALVLLAEPASANRVNPDLLTAALGLTPAESRVAAQLAEGKSVRDMARSMTRSENTIRWHLRQIYGKHGISREVELVRLVLAVAGPSGNASVLKTPHR